MASAAGKAADRQRFAIAHAERFVDGVVCSNGCGGRSWTGGARGRNGNLRGGRRAGSGDAKVSGPPAVDVAALRAVVLRRRYSIDRRAGDGDARRCIVDISGFVLGELAGAADGL